MAGADGGKAYLSLRKTADVSGAEVARMPEGTLLALRETANLSAVDLDEAVARAPRSRIEAQNTTRATQGGLGRGDGRPHFSGSQCSRSRRSRLKGPPGLRPITRHAFATPENVPENEAGMIPGIG